MCWGEDWLCFKRGRGCWVSWWEMGGLGGVVGFLGGGLGCGVWEL